MNKNSNEELHLQLSLEQCPEIKMTGLDSLPTLKQLLVAGGIALMAVLIQLGHDNANGKSTVAATLNDHHQTPSITLTDSQLITDPAKLLPIDLFVENNRSEFIAVPYFSDTVKEEIITGFEQGTKNVGVIYVWDNLGQDGDIIQIESDGLAVDIQLSDEPALIFLPFNPGESLIFRGLHDSGNGISAAIEIPSGVVALPVLAMGEAIELPVR
ncbi:MAG: hypothetical protein MRK00_04375 [Nitrosomonas sp.]|nr:hypothetical protein [Nitrosomonas sp.]